MFRILCKFEPGFKRADGGTRTGKPRQRRRGAWRVLHLWASLNAQGTPVVVSTRQWVGVLCPTPRRVGTRVNPRKLLDEFLHQRRITRMVNSLGKKEARRCA